MFRPVLRHALLAAGILLGSHAAFAENRVALVFYAGHGLQIDGENFLVPVDVDPKREADIPLQAIRLNDVLNTLTSVPKPRTAAAPTVPTRQHRFRPPRSRGFRSKTPSSACGFPSTR